MQIQLKFTFSSDFFGYNAHMKLKSNVIISLVLMILLGSFAYLASHRETDTSEPCELNMTYEIYLAQGESYYVAEDTLKSENPEIADVEGSYIKGTGSGTAKVSAGCNTYTVNVSELYTVPLVDLDKAYLPEGAYSEDDNRYLDTVLAYLIDKAGYQTRAAAVEAVRFLTLRFRYKLNYFSENGRMSSDNYEVDGEGRYYHKGLYISTYKESEISGDSGTSKPWGYSIYEQETGELSQNGLDCSGFISWALYNAGFDCGDIGAGPSDDVYDLTDLGEMVYLSDLDLSKVRCGDLVGLDGHIGMIIGMNENRICVGEAYWVKDLQVRTYDYEEFLNESEWSYVILMNSYYLQDGNYTSFWE